MSETAGVKALLESLGLTEEKILDGIYDRLVKHLDDMRAFDLEGELATKVREDAKKALNEALKTKIEETAVPVLVDRLTEICLQPTNEWGNAKGAPLTLEEFITRRAEEWLKEKVDSQGQISNYSGVPRIQRLAEKVLNEHFAKIIQDATGPILQTMVGGLQTAINAAVIGAFNKIVVENKPQLPGTQKK